MLQLHPRDNVAVVLESAGEGTVPAGHKVALAAIPPGGQVIKYGYPIGLATGPISRGDWVHTHNLRSGLSGSRELTYSPRQEYIVEAASSSLKFPATFPGYRRPGGRVGIRNELWIIPTVGCCNKVAEELALRGRAICRRAGVEGPYAFPHPYGCSQLGEDLERTRRILANLVAHPNAGAVLVLGLGCENNRIGDFRSLVEEIPGRVGWLSAQEVEDEMGAGLKLLEKLARYASGFQREPCSPGELVVGLKCGGSDAFSGITANPLVGLFSDALVAAGGSAILTEVPEMFGAEEPLLQRAATEEVFRQGLAMINAFKDYYRHHNLPVYENPSPGNKEGGITTLEEKSLGCILKGGRSPVTAVYPYGSKVTQKGLSLLEGPGNDPVSLTALAAAGAQLVLFTTGRGTPYGGAVPTVKISSRNSLFAGKSHWIDFNSGSLLEGKERAELAQELIDLVMAIASGETRTRNEVKGYREIAIFKGGVTL